MSLCVQHYAPMTYFAFVSRSSLRLLLKISYIFLLDIPMHANTFNIALLYRIHMLFNMQRKGKRYVLYHYTYGCTCTIFVDRSTAFLKD